MFCGTALFAAADWIYILTTFTGLTSLMVQLSEASVLTICASSPPEDDKLPIIFAHVLPGLSAGFMRTG